MNKTIIYTILIVLTILAFCYIIIVGLDWQSLMVFGTSFNAENINNIFLNLSYSFIAGCIFYLLVTFFPQWEKRKNIRNAIEPNLKNIQIELQTFFLYYSTKLNIKTSDLYSLDISIDELQKNDVFIFDNTTMKFSYLKKGSNGGEIPFGYNENLSEGFNLGHHLISAKSFADVILDHKNIVNEDDVLINILTELTRSYLVRHAVNVSEQNYLLSIPYHSNKLLSEVYIIYTNLHEYIKHDPVKIG